MNTPPPSKSIRISRRTWLGTACIATGAATFSARHILHIRNQEAQEALLQMADQAAAERATAEAETRRLMELEMGLRSQIGARARAELEALHEVETEFTSKAHDLVKSEVNKLHDHAVEQVSSIAATLGSFPQVAGSILLLAKDQVTGSDEMSLALEKELQPISIALQGMTETVNAGLTGVGLIIDENSNALASRMLTMIEQVRREHPVELPEFTTALSDAITVIQGKRMEMGVTVLALPLEIGAVASLMGFLKTALGKWVSRAATTAGANAALAVADGPLPVGEIIALLIDAGFLAWMVTDLLSLAKTVPADIEENLRSTLAAHRDSLLTTAEQAAADTLRQASTARLKALQPLMFP